MLESSSHSGAISVQVQLPMASALMPVLFLEGRSEGQLNFLTSERGHFLLTCQEASWQDTHEQALIKRQKEIHCKMMDVREQT